jgi:hypothetical protein
MKQKKRFLKSLRRGEGVSYIDNPLVAGSNPAGDEIHRSSVAEHRRKTLAADSRRNFGVVEVRVTSVEHPGESRGGCGFESRSLDVRR